VLPQGPKKSKTRFCLDSKQRKVLGSWLRSKKIRASGSRYQEENGEVRKVAFVKQEGGKEMRENCRDPPNNLERRKPPKA